MTKLAFSNSVYSRFQKLAIWAHDVDARGLLWAWDSIPYPPLYLDSFVDDEKVYGHDIKFFNG